MPWSTEFRLKSVADWLRTASAVFALVATLFGFVAYFSDFIHTSNATASDVAKLNSRMGAIEDVFGKTNLDHFRLDRSEQDLAKLGTQLDELSKNVIDIRIMVGKLSERAEKSR